MKDIIENLTQNFSSKTLSDFLRKTSRNYSEILQVVDYENMKDWGFSNGNKIGEIPLENQQKLLICSFQVVSTSGKPLTEKSGKKVQYKFAQSILKNYEHQEYDAGIFVFYDDEKNFRFSLIYPKSIGTTREWSNYRRFTYFVSPQLSNKTFINQMTLCNFTSLDEIIGAFSVEKVTQEFYEQIANWYFWALKKVKFPENAEKEDNGRAMSLIRLITRMMFVWFMYQRGLVPKRLFDKAEMESILQSLKEDECTYYLAILQNLFFATLSMPINKRKFMKESFHGLNKDHGNAYVYRYEELFQDRKKLEELFAQIPFLNGGLFECLDYVDKNDKKNTTYIDGFSSKKKNQPHLPNELFFSEEHFEDLNSAYGTSKKSYRVSGLINILLTFNFTIDENSPDDADVALDPELLGQVFENLLASYNPETSSTARKATGSYYTPREIVDYMVEQSLREYFKIHLSHIDQLDEKLDKLFSVDFSSDESYKGQKLFSESETKELISSIENLRVLDPAVGSGAFPMGMLNKLVYILNKIDEDNKLWKDAQITVVNTIQDPRVQKEAKEKIEEYFREKNADYGRKLYLIQRCIYGVDIQLIAVEIAKLRFFISLLVDEKIDENKDNFGIEPLPNLDFKIMQGNSLISEFMGVDLDTTVELTDDSINLFRKDEQERNPYVTEFEQKKLDFHNESNQKRKGLLKEEIEELIVKIFEENYNKKNEEYSIAITNIKDYERSLLPEVREEQATKIQQKKEKVYKKYNMNLPDFEKQLKELTHRNKYKPFFSWNIYFAEVMSNGGFDIVIGNPPYIQLQNREKIPQRAADALKNASFETYESKGDMYCLFYEKGLKLSKDKTGLLCYITSNKWMRAGYGASLRNFLIRYNPKVLLDLGSGIFESATVDTNILQIKHNTPEKLKLRACDLRTLQKKPVHLSDIPTDKFNILKPKPDTPWVILSKRELLIQQKIEEKGVPLKELDVDINYGIKTGYNSAFIIDTATRNRLVKEDKKSEEVLKPLLRGKDIKRYSTEWDGWWLISNFPAKNIDIEDYPAIRKFLIGFKAKLNQNASKMSTKQRMEIMEHAEKYSIDPKEKNLDKSRKLTGHKWYETQDSIAYYHEFEKEKLVWTPVNGIYSFTLVGRKYYFNNSIFMITTNEKKLRYLLAVCNSKLIQNFGMTKFTNLTTYNQYAYGSKESMENLPIPPISEKEQKPFIDLVDKVLAKRKANQDSTQEEGKIDKLVYQLYGLTDEEIRIVEGETRE